LFGGFPLEGGNTCQFQFWNSETFAQNSRVDTVLIALQDGSNLYSPKEK
jgi:hypothetical protein